MTITFADLRSRWPETGGQEHLGMTALVRRFDGDDPLVIPDYQRGHVWTDRQCARFIGFIAEGGTAPPIFVQRWPLNSGKPDEVLDGLQRATAVCRFVAGSVPMELADGTRVYLRDMTEDDQRLLVRSGGGPHLPIFYVLCPTRADVLRLYIRLNRGGTLHTDAEIARVEAMLAEESR